MNVFLNLFLLLAIHFSAIAQKSFIENNKLNNILPIDESGQVSYKIVKQVDGAAKEELYKRARQWFVKNYSNSKDILEVNDVATGELSGKGAFPLRVKIQRVNFLGLLSHLMLVEVKDNRYRITVTGLRVENQKGYITKYKLPYIGATERHYTTFYEGVNEQITGLVNSLEKALAMSSDF